MTDREPDEEELDKAEEDVEGDVEGHGIDEEDEGEAGVLDINGICA